MRYGISASSLAFLCIIAAMIFGSTFLFARNNVIAEPLRLISVALIGYSFYLRQNKKLNEQEKAYLAPYPARSFETGQG